MIKKIVKIIAQQTIGRLPASKSRLSGNLAIEGGTPLRDLRLRPWASTPNRTRWDWLTKVGPSLRDVFLSGVEGLPQAKQKAFAQKFADSCDCRYGLMMSHGTDALRFALSAALDHDGLDYGGEVIVPNLSFIASATCALDRRFGVAFVDVHPGTLNLDPKRVEEAIIPGRTRAIIPVHQFGQPADMTGLNAIAKTHDLKIIEDAAQAYGAKWESGPVGSLGDAAGFSFQSAKNLNCGEGGMLTTNDQNIFERAYMLQNVGRRPDAGSRWEHEVLGWNCRATEYQAALLSHRMGEFERQQEIRARNFAKLRDLMQEAQCLVPLELHPSVEQHGMYMFVLRYHLDHCGGIGLNDFQKAVCAEGAPLHACYSSTLSEQPAMKGIQEKHPDFIRVLPTPVADKVAHESLYIPANVFLGTETDMQDIAASVRKVERHYN